MIEKNETKYAFYRIDSVLPRHLMFVTCRIRQLVDMGEFEIIKHGKLITDVYGGGDDFMKSIIKRKSI